MYRCKVSFLILSILILVGCNEDIEENPIITVLMYHHFEQDAATSLIVDPNLFRQQLIALKEAGFTSIREKDLLLHLTEGKQLPENPLVITIDDGYLSNFKLAYPILQEQEMYATLYVIGHSRGQTPGEFPHFSWEQAKEMYESGWIDIQSHTYDHHYSIEGINGKGPVLSTKMVTDGIEESEEEYKQRIFEDLLKIKLEIEKNVGNEVYSFTYPYGGYNETVIEILKEIGYKLSYTVEEGIMSNKQSRYTIPRINVDGRENPEELIQKILKYHE
ncbi:polysaccharide deacetylase family protein [Evansella sp. AB-rgal1]|uniref:polysaccharide deacetylase family protein n=1 Tax=Evansella sp. AB-rgal1 TaxID=3242696 RepID=UPI00359CCC2D